MLLRLYTVVVPWFDELVMFYVPPLLQNVGEKRLFNIMHTPFDIDNSHYQRSLLLFVRIYAATPHVNRCKTVSVPTTIPDSTFGSHG